MRIFFAIFSVIFIFSSVQANNIAFIDMDKLLSTSKPGLNILTQLNDLEKKNVNELLKIEKSLKTQETLIASQKNILSEVKLKKEIDKLKLNLKTYNDDRNKIFKELENLRLTNTNKLLQLINPLLHSYAKDKSIEIILQKKNIILGKTALDITDQIILIINKEIKEFKIK
tara:strand:+ start:267 stop:779 length:513 start_codon:yes stop_codon:yes gene_type:complete